MKLLQITNKQQNRLESMRCGGTGETFRKSTKDAIYRKQRGRCHDQLGCGKRMTRRQMQTHHIFAKSWGGPAHSWNGAGMHKRCHSRITRNINGVFYKT